MDRCPICASPLKGTETTCPVCGSSLAPAVSPHLPPGTTLKNGRYTLDKVLGQGGFGITYRASDNQTNTQVAIKELFPEGSARQPGSRLVLPPPSLGLAGFQETMQKLEEEAEVMTRFNHPGIVRMFELFQENNTAYLVMELLKGQTLGKRIEKEGKLSAAEVNDIAMKLMEALEVVHDQGMLHRDIKPDNIFLLQDGRVVLIDFGSAREFIKNKTISHTRLVTPGYAPLEQYGTAGKFGPYTDIYALGATLYHALTGNVPPAATDRVQSNQPLVVPRATPDRLETAINRALEIRVDKRPQSIPEFRGILMGSRRPVPSNTGKPPPPPLPSRKPPPQAPTPQVGNLLIRITPDRAYVRVQGPNGFQRVVQGDMDLNGLVVGQYTLYAQSQGLEDQQIEVQVHPNRSTQVSFTLSSKTAPVPPVPPQPAPRPTPQPTPPKPVPQPAPPQPTPQPAPQPIPPQPPVPQTRSSPVVLWGGMLLGLGVLGIAAALVLGQYALPVKPITVGAYVVMVAAFVGLWPQIAAQIRLPVRTQAPPQPQPQTQTPSRGWLWLYNLLAMLAIGYLLYVVRPESLMNFLKPLDEWFYLNFFSALPELYDWLQATLYAVLGVGVFWLLVYLLTRWAWYWPIGVISVLAFVIFLRAGGPVGAATLAVIVAGATGVLYLMLGVLERYALPLAVGLGAVAAAFWANASEGQYLEPDMLATGALAVVVLVWCCGQIVRLTRRR